jgi:cysteine synthase
MKLFSNLYKKMNIIIGGGPVGSSLALKLAQNNHQVTLINNFINLGSHNDTSRLSRLAFDGTRTEFKLSQQAIINLLKINKTVGEKVITSRPGVLFIASPNTTLAKKLKNGESFDNGLKRLTQAEVNTIFSGYAFNFPHETLYWHHPVGYVVNPIELTKANRVLAAAHGCEIIDAEGRISYNQNNFNITTSNQQSFSTKNLFLLAGASNKQLSEAGDLAIPEFNNTYLTAISTIRYQSASKRGLMPITVGSLQLNSFPYLLDFSTMPESTAIVKTRLSGPQGSETIKSVNEKNSLASEVAKQNSLNLFNQVLPNLGVPIDFTRCITYRNTSPSMAGIGFLEAKFSQEHNRNEEHHFPTLITTLGCYGVHVKYGSIIADSIYQYLFKQMTVNGCKVDQIRIMKHNYIKELLPKYTEFLDKSGLGKKIGSTPMKKISDNLFLKQEGYNFSGSIKDRVALYVLLKKLETKAIKDGDTLVISTSGSYGVSVLTIKKLLQEHLNIKLSVIIITPLAYREKPGIVFARDLGLKEVKEADYSEFRCNEDIILYADGSFASAIELAKKFKEVKSHIYLDQHFDSMHVDAHESTAKELLEQLPNMTDVISVTGTGATVMGLCNHLPKHIKIHSRPAVSGEISGLTDPRKYGNFFNTKRLSGYDKCFLQKKSALKQKELVQSQFDLEISDSTGAALSIVEEVKENNPNAVIAVISPSFRY